MLSFFKRNYDYKALTDRVADFSQLAGVKRYVFTCGRSKDVEAVDIRTGNGLNYTVLLDRALDIAWVEYKGIPFAYMTEAGVVSPKYYECESNEWLRSFTGGLMTTCGLSNVGKACELDGKKFGQHGRISSLPGENINIEDGYDGENYVISIKGQVKQVKAFVENMVLQRTIKSYAGKNMIMIKDIVENKSTFRQPFMILYHFNFGFPIVNEHSEIIIPNVNKKAGKLDAEGYKKFRRPDKVIEEETFFFEAVSNTNGDSYFLLTNDKDNPELAVKVKYSRSSLDRLIMWKYLNQKNYVLCMEPANCCIGGVANEFDKGSLVYLEPSEMKEINIEIEVLENKEEISKWKEFITCLL